MVTYCCEHLLAGERWLSPGRLEVDAQGTILRVEAAPAQPADVLLNGFVVPTISNLHSHAFQRALSGRTEHRAADRAADSFWTWRTAMYELALSITPEDQQAIAAQLYVEMLQAGMSAVGEFHYLHHAPDGSRYDDLAQTSQSVLAAAEATGIAMTLLPVAYLSGGFDAPPLPQQRRFVCKDADEVLALRSSAQRAAARVPHAQVGLAPHSLRAVGPEAMQSLLQGLFNDTPQARVHIHVAEQQLEVQQCIEARGVRPVRWLLDHCDLDARWCAVHATHLDADEVRDLAASGAVAGLCPSTEANLGDGVFAGPNYMLQGGGFGIGSDSHVSVSATEELRLFEYSQRLVHEQRNLLLGAADESERHIGRLLWTQAAQGGAQALHQPIGVLQPGKRADFVVLNKAHPRLVAHDTRTVLDAFVFGGADAAIDQVYVAGAAKVVDGRHVHAETIAQRFRAVMTRLYEE